MEPNTAPPRQRLHPIVIAAAASIIALSAVGIGTMLYSRTEAKSEAPAASASASGNANNAAPPPGFDNTAPAAANSSAAVAANPPEPVQATAPLDATLAPPPPGLAPAHCLDCATVVAERPIRVRGRGTGLGAVGGGIAGGLLGNSIGRGRGNVALTVLGAAGGAYAGNAIEENANNRTEYELVLRYPDGRQRTFTHVHPWSYQLGQTVRVVQGRVVALN